MMRPRNRLYHRYILDQMKVEATGEGAVISAAERAAINGLAHRLGLRRRLIAPRYGFAGAEDYYERCRPMRFMSGIGIPTLVLAAFDDPWIPGTLYREYDWTRIRRSHRFCLTVVAMSASMAAAAASRGATSW